MDPSNCGWSGGGDGATGGTVWTPAWYCGDNNTIEFFDRDFTNSVYVVSGGVIMHEFGHVLGIDHNVALNCNPSCQSNLCSIGQANTGKQEHSEFFVDDQDFMRFKYGPSNNNYDHLESGNAISWLALPASSPPTHLPAAGLSDNATGGPYMTMNERTPSGGYSIQYRWTSGTMSWDLWGFQSNTGTGALGSAYNYPSSTAYFVQQSNEVIDNSDKLLQWAKQTSPGFPSYYSGTPSTNTERHGADVAYDPRSGFIIATTRAEKVAGITENWQILITIVNPVTNQVIRVQALGTWADPILASDTPSIACGPGSIGTYNCILAWGTAGDPDEIPVGVKGHVLRTQQFGLLSIFGVWYVATSPMQTVGPGNGYTAYSRPAVTYKGPLGDAGAFVLSWVVPAYGSTSSYQYTMRKSMDSGAAWTSLVALSSNGKFRNTPELGAQNTYAELVRSWEP